MVFLFSYTGLAFADYILNPGHFHTFCPKFICSLFVKRGGCGFFLSGQVKKFSAYTFYFLRNPKVVDRLCRNFSRPQGLIKKMLFYPAVNGTVFLTCLGSDSSWMQCIY